MHDKGEKDGAVSRPLRLCFIGVSDNPETVRYFIPSGNFRKVSTSGSVRVEGDDVTLVWSSKYVGQGLLRIIGQVKNHVRKRFREGKVSTVNHKPRYSSVGSLGRAARAVELDLSSAYLSAARKIGAIDDAIYKRLSECSKETRLMALGALATRATVTEYCSWKKTGDAEIRYDKETGEVWRRIVAEVDRTMQDLAREAGTSFLYYWCDAIFIKPSAAELVEQRAAVLGYRMRKKAVILGVFGKMGRWIGVDDGRKFSLNARRVGT